MHILNVSKLHCVIQVIMKWAISILFLLFISMQLKAQEIITLDMSSNTIKRSTVIRSDSFDLTFSKDSLISDYLHKKPNRRWEIKNERYSKVLRAPLKIGDYLVFELTNIGKDKKVDSVYVSYDFLDRNVQEYSSTFKNVFNNKLNAFESTSTTDETKNDNKPSNPDEVAQTGSNSAAAFAGSNNEIDNADILQSYKNIIKVYSHKSQVTELGIVSSINDSLNLISDLDDFYTLIGEQQSDSADIENIIVALISSENSEHQNFNIFEYLNNEYDLDLSVGELRIIDEKLVNQKQAKLKTKTNESSGNLGSHSAKNSISYTPLQIQNNDITYFYLEGFKNGKKVYERPFMFHNKGGFKADFSAGFIGTNLIDKNYFLKPMKDTSYVRSNGIVTDSIDTISDVNEINLADEGGFNIGISVMAHFYLRIGRRLNFAISPGFSLDTDSRINYLIGGSVIMGLEQRFIINAGLNFGKIKELSEVYEEGEIIPASITELPERDKWSRGFFIGLSYNL